MLQINDQNAEVALEFWTMYTCL